MIGNTLSILLFDIVDILRGNPTPRPSHATPPAKACPLPAKRRGGIWCTWQMAKPGLGLSIEEIVEANNGSKTFGLSA